MSGRRGRRDNGLTAAEYAAAGDVDPRVGEHLLDVLGLSGIAAYLQPTADLHPVTRTTTLPARPIDRLYVDRTHLAAARDLLSRVEEPPADTSRAEAEQAEPTRADRTVPPEPSITDTSVVGPMAATEPADFDAIWASIVAGYHRDAGASEHGWPEVEDVPGPRLAERPPPPAPAEQPSLLEGLDTFGAGLPDADEEGYDPPPPPPLPRISKYAALGIIGIVGGLVLFFWPEILPIDPQFTLLLGFGGILAGFVTLVLRLRAGDADDEDPGDGAVV